MKASRNDKVIAESDKTINIAGNQHFPPVPVTKEYVTLTRFAPGKEQHRMITWLLTETTRTFPGTTLSHLHALQRSKITSPFGMAY